MRERQQRGRWSKLLISVILSVLAPVVFAADKTLDEALAKARAIYSNQGAAAALPEFQKLEVAYRASGDRLGEAITIGLIGNCYKRLGDTNKALQLLESALKLKRDLGARDEEGKTLSHIGLVYWERGAYDKAIASFNQSILIARELKDVQLEAAALNNLSLVYDEKGDYHRSLDQYKVALDLHRSVKYEPGESDTLGNIGGVYLLLGRFGEAESYYRQSLEISRRLGLKPSQTQDLGNIALCQLGQGEIKQSIDTYNEAISLASSAGMAKEEADWYRGRASALFQIGEFDRGLKDYGHSLEIYRKAGLRRELVDALVDLASAHAVLGDISQSRRRLREATKLSRDIGYRRGVISNQLALAESLRLSGLQTAALDAVHNALKESRQSGESGFTVDGLLTEVRIFESTRHLRSALQRADQAVTQAKQNGLRLKESEALDLRGGLECSDSKAEAGLADLQQALTIAAENDTEARWHINYQRGRCFEELGRDDDAIGAYRDAIAVIEGIRARIAEQRFRTGYFQDKQKVYLALVRVLVRRQQNEQAFEVSERLRRYSFMRSVGTNAVLPRSHDLEAAASRVRYLQEKLDEETSKPPTRMRAEASRTFSEELAEAQRELGSLFEKSNGEGKLSKISSVTTEAVQQKLPPRVALIEYLVDEDAVTAFVLTSAGMQVVVTAIPERQLRTRVELFRDLVSDRTSNLWSKPALSLGELLIARLRGQGLLAGMQSLIIVPHGTLNYVPFAALLIRSGTRQRFVAEEFDVSEAPTAAALLGTNDHPVDSQEHLLAMAPERSRLKYSIPEAKRIASLFGRRGEAIVGRNATETVLKRNAEKAQIIHLATHAYFNHANPLFSVLELEPDAENDGRLEVYEVMQLHLNTRLVTLSACETAMGAGEFSETPAGDEFVSLSRAFLEAGSESVVATLWDVDDRSTLTIMNSLYRDLKHEAGPEALSNAQRAMLHSSNHRHPYYWAPFVFIGSEFSQAMAEKR